MAGVTDFKSEVLQIAGIQIVGKGVRFRKS